MVYLNSHMKQILSTGRIDNQIVERIKIQAEDLISKSKDIHECVILDLDGRLDSGKINLSRVLMFAGDRTGYEASCNEMRFSIDDVPVVGIPEFAEAVLHCLSAKYQNKQFCIYVSFEGQNLDLRFHTYRPDEGTWLKRDLDSYDTPIYCLIPE